MEAANAADPANGEETRVPPVDHVEGAIGDLTNDHKLDAQSNSKIDIADAKSLNGNSENKNKSAEKEPTTEDKPSQRVQEGQRWNDRPRRFNNTNDRTIYKRNNKSDLTSQAESSDPVAIRKQVEFYFSDSNLLQDKFLFTKVEGHENLPVPISVIHSFKRMRHFQPLSAVVVALKESKTLNVVEDETCIQRKEPLPEGLVGKPMVEIQKVHEDKSMARSIYAKGFGDEEPKTQFEIEAFFANYGSTNSVRLRRAYDQSFKGSVFVEFDCEETQKSFLTLDPKPKWQGKELQIKSKKQYCDDKVDDIKAGKVRPNEKDNESGQHHKQSYKRRRDSPDYDNGGRGDKKDDRDWRERREEDRKSGFRGKSGGKHRGFGSSGRGRGGRDDRRHRDRNDERDERGVPKVRATTPDSNNKGSPPAATPTDTPKKDDVPSEVGGNVSKADESGEKLADTNMELEPRPPVKDSTNGTSPIDSSSKKRGREEDEIPEGEGSAKKVDIKGGAS